MEPATRTAASPFGARLRQWRSHRGLSQLALAAAVGSTARHLSFLETGRSRPSRQMVLRLGEVLGVSLRERNQLLQAAGLPVAYPQADLRGGDLAPYLAAVDRLLQAHLPYPAMVLDAYGTVLLANGACRALFGADILGVNLTRRFLADPAARKAIANWPEVAWAGRPWTSPVYFAPGGDREFYWVSATDARHSRNLAERPQVSMVVFDSTVAPYHGRAVYAVGEARDLSGSDLDRALAAYPRSDGQGAAPVTRPEVTAPAPYRLYRAVASDMWVLCPREPRQPCPLHGLATDHRTRVPAP